MTKLPILLSILFTLLTFSTFGQEIDKQTLRCQYKLTYVKDSTNPTKLSEDLMILELGKKSSKFYSYYTFFADSLMAEDTKAGVPEMEMFANRAKYGTPRATYTVYNNYPDNKITVVDKIGIDYYSFEELVTTPRWVLKPEFDTILSYRCQKAVCIFMGRSYVAWFAKGIPVNGGPWKFSGLPGLILKIKDTRNHYLFQCVGLKSTTASITFDKREVFNVSKGEYDKTIRRYYSDPFGFLESSRGVTISGDRPSKPYNPIDLTR